jgi:hypothetical protein
LQEESTISDYFEIVQGGPSPQISVTPVTGFRDSISTIGGGVFTATTDFQTTSTTTVFYGSSSSPSSTDSAGGSSVTSIEIALSTAIVPISGKEQNGIHLSKPAIIGISVFGGVAGIVILIILMCVCMSHSSKRCL